MIQQLALDSATALQQLRFRNHARFSNCASATPRFSNCASATTAVQQLRFSNCRGGSATEFQQLPRFSNCVSATAAVQQLRFSNCRDSAAVASATVASATALQQPPRFRNWPSGSATALEHGPVRFGTRAFMSKT